MVSPHSNVCQKNLVNPHMWGVHPAQSSRRKWRRMDVLTGDPKPHMRHGNPVANLRQLLFEGVIAWVEKLVILWMISQGDIGK